MVGVCSVADAVRIAHRILRLSSYWCFSISFTYQRITRAPSAPGVFLQRAAIDEVEDVTVSSILGAFYRGKQALQKPVLPPCYVAISSGIRDAGGAS
jgi:hypothetical protein